ncbi:hypothetical protein GCM10023187_28080 [Nibrella viscosa]|uniref:Quinol:cytochrome c oxidoreductase quinone-binding subunit 2 n=1 Tax=Nibrella viscosa TaxID=1084524 RepID=A0ABP8KIW5_9BACT
MASVHAAPSVEEQYEFTSETKRRLLIGGIAGLVLIGLGAFLLASGIGGHDTHEIAPEAAEAARGISGPHEFHWTTRLWANIWLNSVYFTGLAVVGMFFLSYTYLAQAGWHVAFKRIPEAMPAFLPFTGIIMLITFLVAGHDLFHWTHGELYDPANELFDPIIDGKRGYLNTPFFLIRMVLYFALWYGLWFMLRKQSLQEDELGGLDQYNKSIRYGTIFLVVFAVTSSTSAWDFVMSIDTHWFSTMFGWYTLASWHVAGLAVITLTVVTLKERGYLQAVNASHLHDLGKFVFAFSIFWTYVWFAQFMLIYYANLPEEIIYYEERFSGFGGIYKIPFFINVFLNFAFPFLVLMTRDAKRTHIFLKIACWGVIIGHYFDFYNNIMPGTVGEHGGFGPLEFGMILLFACAFIWSVANQLTKANLVPVNHPMLEETVHHDI